MMKNLTTKILAMILAVLMLTLPLSSCTKDSGASSATQTDAPTDEPTEKPTEKPSEPSQPSEEYTPSDFEIYQSNTICATGNNGILTSEEAVTARYRAMMRPEQTGELEYKLFFSNNVDSTWGGSNDPTCHPGTETQPYTVNYARLCAGTDITSPVILNYVDLTFDGEYTKEVAAEETYWSDAVYLDVGANDYIIFEWEITYTVIPATNICGTFYGAKYNYSTNSYSKDAWNTPLPLPDLIGANRGNSLRVGFLGDSITMGQGAGTASYKFYAGQIASALGENVSCWNLGLGYARANDVVKSKYWLEKAKNNDVVIICLGVNDISSGIYPNEDGTLTRSAEQLIGDIEYIAKELAEAGCEVIIFSTPPFKYSGAAREATHQEVVKQLEELADENGYKFFDMASYLASDSNPSLMKYPASADANGYPKDAHPNQEGCKIVADAFIESGLIEIP